MMSYYASIIFIGILLIVGSLFMILFDRKKSHDYLGRLEDKQKEMERVVNDAEQMLEEMNRFSEYVVTQMEIKNQEFVGSIQRFEQKAGAILNCKVNTLEEVTEEGEVAPDKQPVVLRQKKDAIVVPETIEQNQEISPLNQFQKVVPINTKHKQVIELAKVGMDSNEIAKQLNIGKGEIQLIMQMNK